MNVCCWERRVVNIAFLYGCYAGETGAASPRMYIENINLGKLNVYNAAVVKDRQGKNNVGR